jgi:hypothetical protein
MFLVLSSLLFVHRSSGIGHPASVIGPYNFGPEFLAGLNLSINLKRKSLCFAGSEIVLRIAKLRI